MTIHQSHVFRRSNGVVLVTEKVPSQKLGALVTVMQVTTDDDDDDVN